MLSTIQLNALVAEMTLEEKINMLHGNGLFETKGIKRLNIPSLKMSDGPMGVRNEFPTRSWIPKDLSDDYVTYFLSNTALAATWNEEHAYLFGQHLGAESRSRGKDVILAPGINIIRSPYCGRNFEYMSEDPYLTSRLVVPVIKGIQEKDVAACVKHFVANNQETNRLRINVEIDDQSLEEIYFPAFKAAITEGNSYTLMGAYNKLRGDYCCESSFLLQEVLRDRWNFDGIVISDWGACHSTNKAILNGLDIEMSVTTDFEDYYFGNPLYSLLEHNIINIEIINTKVMKILNVMNKLHMLDGERQKGERNTSLHQSSTLQAAEESIVLLKNEHNFLPLDLNLDQSIAVIGDNANKAHSNGGGSAAIKALYEHTPLAGISMLLGGSRKLTYVQGYSSAKDVTKDMLFNLREEAIRIATTHDIVILIGGLNHDFDTEGKDRNQYQLPFEQDLLIKEVSLANPNLVIVNISGSAVDLTCASSYSKALIQTWYNGMEGGRALAQVIFGITNPSGKLPFTFAKQIQDYPSHSIGEFPGNESVFYNEGIFVGYRYFDSFDIEPLYPFGHGLSYTNFQLSDLTLTPSDNVSIGENDHITVNLNIRNTGMMEGKEVIQLYVKHKNPSEKRPSKELKRFKKISLKPKEIKTISFTLHKSDFAFFSNTLHQWTTKSGDYQLLIGSSSRILPIEMDISLDFTTVDHSCID